MNRTCFRHTPTPTLVIFALLTCGLLSSCMSILRSQPVLLDGKQPAEAPVRAKVQAELAGSYLAINQLEIAKSEADKALRIDPNSPEANNVAGLIAMQISKYSEAETYFNRALRANGENSSYLNNLALLYCKNGSPAQGLDMLQRALDNKLYATPENSLMNAGICAEAMNNLTLAERYFSQAEKFSNMSLQAREKLAEIYLKTGRADQAWRSANELMAVADHATPNQITLAINAARAIGRTDEANRLSQRLKLDYPEFSKQQKNINAITPTLESPSYGNLPAPSLPTGAYGYPQQAPPQANTYAIPESNPYPQATPQYPTYPTPPIAYPQNYPQNQYPTQAYPEAQAPQSYNQAPQSYNQAPTYPTYPTTPQYQPYPQQYPQSYPAYPQ